VSLTDPIKDANSRTVTVNSIMCQRRSYIQLSGCSIPKCLFKNHSLKPGEKELFSLTFELRLQERLLLLDEYPTNWACYAFLGHFRKHL